MWKYLTTLSAASGVLPEPGSAPPGDGAAMSGPGGRGAPVHCRRRVVQRMPAGAARLEAQNGSEEGSGTAAMVRSTPTNSAAVLNLASSSLRGPPRGVDARSDYVQFSGGGARRPSPPTAP